MNAALALLCGLLIGSFLNVCIHRWPRGRSVIRPRSHCVRCRKTIAWYDNIPVVSYLILRGKCRHCGRPISLRYPFVELAAGVLFAYFATTLGPTLEALKMCLFAAMVIALIFADLEKRILPDQFTLGGAAIGLAFAAVVPIHDLAAGPLLWVFGMKEDGRGEWFLEAALGALLPASFLWLGGWIYEKVRRKEGLGFGDVKLMMMVGSFLGLQAALLTLLAGSVLGSIVSMFYIWAAKKDAASYQLPFGSFLGAASLLVAITGSRLLGLYGNL